MTITTAPTQSIDFPSSRLAGFSLTLAGWFLIALALGLGDAYSATDGVLALAMPGAILTPVIVFLLAYAVFPRVRERVLAVDTRLLVLLHTWRMVGLGFLMLLAFDLLPAVFAIPAGIGDAAAAAWALVVGVGLYGGFGVSRRHLLAWNVFGLADFIVVVSIGTLSRYGFLPVSASDVTTFAMGQFPLVLIPTFVVPLLTITHVVIYLQVKNNRESGTRESLTEPEGMPVSRKDAIIPGT